MATMTQDELERRLFTAYEEGGDHGHLFCIHNLGAYCIALQD